MGKKWIWFSVFVLFSGSLFAEVCTAVAQCGPYSPSVVQCSADGGPHGAVRCYHMSSRVVCTSYNSDGSVEFTEINYCMSGGGGSTDCSRCWTDPFNCPTECEWPYMT